MKLLQIYNAGAHYRAPIFKKMSEEFHCDFVFGENEAGIKKIDYRELKGNVYEVKNVRYGRTFYYQKGVLKYLFSDYDTYLLLGEPRCLSTWLFLVLKMFKKNKRVFLWTHGWYGKEGNIRRLISKTFYKMCQGAFIYNNRSRELMIKGGIPSSKLHTIYNSLDYDTETRIRATLRPTEVYRNHFKNQLFNVVFIGRLTKVKRLDLIFSALVYAKKHGSEFNVTIIGSGETYEELKKTAEDKGLLGNVWLYGAEYDEEKIAQMIYDADVCVSPGNVGLTAMHSMVYGCPVITHDDFPHQMPEFEAIQEGATGTFFKINDPVSLFDAIKRWQDDHQDREVVRRRCYEEIDNRWNPNTQMGIFKKVLYS